MDDGRSVLIPSFLFFVPARSASLSECRSLRHPAPLPVSGLSLPVFGLPVSVFGFLCSVSGFSCPYSVLRCSCPAFFDANLRLPVPSARSPASASCRPVSAAPFLPPRFCRPGPAARFCRPFLSPGLPFYLFAALSVRNRPWILPMRHSSEDCPAMPVQYVDTHCIYSCIAAVRSGSVSGCAGSSMLPNC